MSGIYQLNQATGSVTLPSSGNTFIGTTPNNELFSVDPAGTVTIYGTGGGGTIDTGSFATTGSNTFSGSQNIIGDVTSSGTFYSQQLRIMSGSSGVYNIGSGDAAVIYISSSNANYSPNATVTPNPLVLQTIHDSVPSPNTKASAILLASNNYNDNKTAITQLATVNMATNNHDSAFTIMIRNGVGNRNEVLRILSDGSTIISGSLVVDSTLPGLSNKGVQVTGSVTGNVRVLTIASSTASMDLSQGNFFTLTLAPGSNTHLSPTNIQPGQTINLKISQPATSGSLTYDSTLKFPGGIPYSASAKGSVVDILSMVSFDSSTLYATAIKNLS